MILTTLVSYSVGEDLTCLYHAALNLVSRLASLRGGT